MFPPLLKDFDLHQAKKRKVTQKKTTTNCGSNKRVKLKKNMNKKAILSKKKLKEVGSLARKCFERQVRQLLLLFTKSGYQKLCFSILVRSFPI